MLRQQIKPGDVVEKVSVTKDDNIDDTGREGYKITLTISGKSAHYLLDTIDELEDMPRGIYEYVNGEYKQIENWESETF